MDAGDDSSEPRLRARLSELTRDARAVVERFGDGGTLLCVTPPIADGDALEQLDRAFESLRAMSSRESLRERGFDMGFRIEDMLALVVAAPGEDRPPHTRAEEILRWLERRLPATKLELRVTDGPLVLAAAFAPRVGGSPTRARYELEPDGRLRVEAFELHVVEHCNLRCASCCNMSPLVEASTMTVDEVASMARRMSTALVADVFKIMGGEPLLHPEIAEVLRVVRESGIGDRVRLFTNGLLLKSMSDPFFEALDELTISSYASAPVRPAILDLARARAREHGFVLNVKPVREFSYVLSPRFERDDAALERTYRQCWLRHRCLIVREGRFYMCTRAAYAGDFLERARREPIPDDVLFDRSSDGEPVDGPRLARRLADYMNRAHPLAACRYCFGGDGPVAPHTQLTRQQVRDGILSPGLLVR